MAVTINVLNAGNITVTLESSRDYSKTRVWYSENESDYVDYNISGSILGDVMDYVPTNQIPNVSEIRKIEFGNLVTSIALYAFGGCTNLTSIKIPNSVENLGQEAFTDCSNLTDITLPDTIEIEQSSAFWMDKKISNVTITANGGNAQNVKENLINEGVPNSGVTWNMPS